MTLLVQNAQIKQAKYVRNSNVGRSKFGTLRICFRIIFFNQGGSVIRLFHKELEAYMVAEGLFDDEVTEDGKCSTAAGPIIVQTCFIEFLLLSIAFQIFRKCKHRTECLIKR